MSICAICVDGVRHSTVPYAADSICHKSIHTIHLHQHQKILYCSKLLIYKDLRDAGATPPAVSRLLVRTYVNSRKIKKRT